MLLLLQMRTDMKRMKKAMSCFLNIALTARAEGMTKKRFRLILKQALLNASGQAVISMVILWI